jgi:chromosome segregation ATPase
MSDLNEQKGQLRGTPLGGFRRQDVLACLESQEREHQQALAELQGQLDRETQARQALERTVAEQKETLEQNAAERKAQQTRQEQLEQTLSEGEAALAAARQTLTEREGELDRLKQARTALQAEVARLGPLAAAYEEIKERSAGIELDAHRRAQTILREAEEQANRLREETEQWLDRVAGRYDQLRTELDTTISHTVYELVQLQQSLEKAPEEFDACDQRLAELDRTYREGTTDGE